MCKGTEHETTDSWLHGVSLSVVGETGKEGGGEKRSRENEVPLNAA